MLIDKVDGKIIQFPQLRGSLAGMKFPAFAEVKYDGEFNYIHKNNGDIFTINKYGTMRRDFPALNNLYKELGYNQIKSATMLCEIYWNGGRLGALYDLLSHKKDDKIEFKIFDIIELNGDNTRIKPLIERKEILHEIGLTNYLGKCWVVEDQKDAERCFLEVCGLGYEGIVVKDFNGLFINGPCSWVKLKSKDQTDYPVQNIDPVKERIEISANGILVGVKAPNRYKKYIKLGDMVTIEHQGVLASGSLRHPVLIPKKEWK